MNEKIPTPNSYVERMLDEAEYKQNVYGKRVLENSCGEGNILCLIAERYILDARSNHVEDKELLQRLHEDICGYEIDRELIKKCICRLNQIAANFGLHGVEWNIHYEDYLFSDNGTYDYIIGNPPYITYHDLAEEQRIKLKETFFSCQEGRFDYYYAFIEKSIKSLKQGGVLVYLIPYGLFRNRFAKNVRGMVLPGLEKVIDYQGEKVFSDVLVSTSVIVFKKQIVDKAVIYQKKGTNEVIAVQKSELSDKWNFHIIQSGERRFGDVYSVQNCIATLCNDVYIIEPIDEDESFYYLKNDYRIEKEIVYPAVSAKAYRSTTMQKKIIVPYMLYEGGYRKYTETDMEELFPQTMRYLQSKRLSLLKRKTSKGSAWFEYGRSQALGSIIGEKLVASMVATNRFQVNIAGEKDIPYAGYFIKSRDGDIESLYKAKKILESQAFYDYLRYCGTPTALKSYRISVNEIKEFPLSYGE